MDRRQFCMNMLALGSGAVLAPLLEACARTGSPELATTPPFTPTATASNVPAATATTAPTATSQPTPTTARPDPTAAPTATATPDPSLAAVALVATSDRAAGVRRAIELLGINPVRGYNVLLKPNFNSADAAPGSTHPDVLKALPVSYTHLDVYKRQPRSSAGWRCVCGTGAKSCSVQLDVTTVGRSFDQRRESERPREVICPARRRFRPGPGSSWVDRTEPGGLAPQCACDAET